MVSIIKNLKLNTLLLSLCLIFFGCTQKIPLAIKLWQPLPDTYQFSKGKKLGPTIGLFISSLGTQPGIPDANSIPEIYEIKSIIPQETYFFPVGYSLERVFNVMLRQHYDNVVYEDFAPIKLEAKIDFFRLFNTGINKSATCNMIVSIKVISNSGELIENQFFETSKTSLFDGINQPVAIWDAIYDIAKQVNQIFISSEKIARNSNNGA